MFSLCELELTAIMFLIYHVTTGSLVFASYMSQSSDLFLVSIAEAALFFGITVVVAVLFSKRPNNFGQYKSAFKPDQYSQHHYLCLLAFRVAEASILVMAGMDYVSFIAAALPLATIVLLAVRRPYIHAYNNMRAIINEVVPLLCLGIYGYYRCFVADQDRLNTLNDMLPFILVGLLLLS